MGVNEIIQIGSKIKEFRKAKGITQKEMAKRLNIPYSTYSNYENNNREPNITQIEAIAKELEIDVFELLDISQYKTPKKEFSEIIDNELEKWKYDQEMGYSGILDIELLKDFRKLNKTGQLEAKKRVQELTEIPKYTQEEKEALKNYSEFVKDKDSEYWKNMSKQLKDISDQGE